MTPLRLALGTLALFLLASSLHAQLYLKDHKLSVTEVRLRADALKKLFEWDKLDEIDSKGRAVSNGRYKLATSLNATDRKQAEYILAVIEEIDRSHRSTAAGAAKYYIEDYMESNARALAVHEAALLKTQQFNEDKALAKDPKTRIRFEFFGPVINDQIRDFEMRADQLRGRDTKRIMSADHVEKKVPLVRTVDNRPTTNENIDFLPLSAWPPRGATTSNSRPTPFEGISGHAADYAIETEQDARIEYLRELHALRKDPKLSTADAAQVDAHIQQAEYDLKIFDQQIKDFDRSSRNEPTLLSTFMGDQYAKPRVLPEVKYYPYSQTESHRSAAEITTRKERAKADRVVAINDLARQALEVESERARYIDNILPGYSDLERQHQDLGVRISDLGRQIDERNNYGAQEIENRKRLYPIRNEEFMIWKEIDALDRLIATQDISPDDLRYIQGLGHLKAEYPSSEINDFKARRDRLLERLRGEMTKNKTQIATEKALLVESQHDLEDKMTLQRLGLDLEPLDKRLAALQSEKRAALSRGDFSEADPSEKARIKIIDDNIKTIVEVKDRLLLRRSIATQHYEKNPFIGRHGPKTAPKLSKVDQRQNLIIQLKEHCRSLVQKAAVLLTL